MKISAFIIAAFISAFATHANALTNWTFYPNAACKAGTGVLVQAVAPHTCVNVVAGLGGPYRSVLPGALNGATLGSVYTNTGCTGAAYEIFAPQANICHTVTNTQSSGFEFS